LSPLIADRSFNSGVSTRVSATLTFECEYGAERMETSVGSSDFLFGMVV
jgi:hypothetical protein